MAKHEVQVVQPPIEVLAIQPNTNQNWVGIQHFIFICAL